MSFHGGFAGVVIASILFCRRERIPLLSMGDLLAVATPTGLMARSHRRLWTSSPEMVRCRRSERRDRAPPTG
ncbi:prolipoprotein diacylglyceryl transferase family protein [Mycobacterium tuberculosis]|uniref:prolipoprotein diacylglyceryl transferase family protein n=1 Tax=Mycobacterium tuberculosis TaxID=1773 RepID=UPI00272A9EEB|nr:prolipoprotein diacylglyceryl transferase family protein [Mycobacterium tuberculosis]